MFRNRFAPVQSIHKCGREDGSLPHLEEHVSWSNARPRAHWMRDADQLQVEYTSLAVCNGVLSTMREWMTIAISPEGAVMISSTDINNGVLTVARSEAERGYRIQSLACTGTRCADTDLVSQWSSP